ncbi:outer membrane protein [Tibeticola sediminis]|uniref:Outer membrane protein n=1 Tax=Tibeticola sediminis TaxID=1917811 RepID=A0A3N4UYP5_9BURK|nr:TolC family outer membrane protein [Tibeticola sediminis]RPE72741.1 outer membrane protein [Tibeticola sediminis]
MTSFPLPSAPIRLAAVAVCALMAAAPLRAQSLLDVYEAARGYDASYQAALAQRDATLARAEQARAAILPTVGVGASASRTAMEVNVPVPTDRAYGTQTLGINASQPIYRPANLATAEQGKKQAELAEAQLLRAEQDLIVRVSQAYFDVLSAREALNVVRAQKAAVSEQLAAAKRNFEVGTATITDTREAQARYDLVLAQELASENDLRVKQLALDQLVGKPNIDPKPLRQPVSLPALTPANIDAWVQQALDAHPALRQARIGLDVARLELKKAEAGHLPTVDLTASYGVTRNINGSSMSMGSSRVTAGSIGVNFAVPVFAGYAIQNRVKEALALETKAQSDLEAAQRTIAQATRAAFLGVQSGMAQVRALEAAEQSSKTALEANQLGYQVGVRINIDVLNAQSQLYQTQRDLAQARYSVLVGNLKLRQASGVLKAEDLQPVNALLAP